MLQKRYWRHLDPVLIAAVVGVVLYGIVVLASATRYPLSNLFDWPSWLAFSKHSQVQRQIIWAVGGTVIALLTTLFDYRALARWTPLFYVGMLGLLGALLFIGSGDGASRWLSVGGFQLQPSEFAKLVFIVTLAALLTRNDEEEEDPPPITWTDVLLTFALLAPMLALIILQPDLGTALVLLGIVIGMLLVAGLPLLHLALLTFGGLAAGVAAVLARLYFDAPIPLQDYQLKRLIIFLNPESDPFDAGYQILQSEYAIGSGQLLGRGLFQGEQGGLNYLPERHTDFIFAVVGEELGFIGAVALIALVFIVLWRIFRVVGMAKDRFGALIAGGVGSMIAFHAIVNIGMTIGLMPVTGVPLPFFSYGGSSLLANSLGVGLTLNVLMRRHKLFFAD